MTMIRCGGWGGWLRALEASGGQCGPQGGGGWVRGGLKAAAQRARRLGLMGKSRGRDVGVDAGALARGTPMEPGRNGES
jgi:hypothetical protein